MTDSSCHSSGLQWHGEWSSYSDILTTVSSINRRPHIATKLVTVTRRALSPRKYFNAAQQVHRLSTEAIPNLVLAPCLTFVLFDV